VGLLPGFRVRQDRNAERPSHLGAAGTEGQGDPRVREAQVLVSGGVHHGHHGDPEVNPEVAGVDCGADPEDLKGLGRVPPLGRPHQGVREQEDAFRWAWRVLEGCGQASEEFAIVVQHGQAELLPPRILVHFVGCLDQLPAQTGVDPVAGGPVVDGPDQPIHCRGGGIEDLRHDLFHRGRLDVDPPLPEFRQVTLPRSAKVQILTETNSLDPGQEDLLPGFGLILLKATVDELPGFGRLARRSDLALAASSLALSSASRARASSEDR
jgi:hypothetical protein